MKKNNDNKKIKTETNIFFSLPLCKPGELLHCVGSKYNGDKVWGSSEEEGRGGGDRGERQKDKARDIQKMSAVGQECGEGAGGGRGGDQSR